MQKAIPIKIIVLSIFLFAQVLMNLLSPWAGQIPLGAIYLITLIGFISLKPYGWALAIALQCQEILGLFNLRLILGYHAVSNAELILRFVIACILLRILFGPSLREIFSSEKFRWKSWYVALMVVQVVFVLAILIMSLSLRVSIFQDGAGGFAPKPQLISLAEVNEDILKGRFKRQEALNISLLIPESFTVYKEEKSSIIFVNQEDGDEKVVMNFMIVDNDNEFLGPPDEHREMLSKMRIKTDYEFAHFCFFDNWSPVAFICGAIGFGQRSDSKLFDNGNVKGVLRFSSTKGCACNAFLFDQDGNMIGQITMGGAECSLLEEEALIIFSSMKLTK